MADDPRNVTGNIKGNSPMTDKLGPFAPVRDPHLLGTQFDEQGRPIIRQVRKENRKNQQRGGSSARDVDGDWY